MLSETIINEAGQLEITAKANLNSINKVLSMAYPTETKVKEQSHARNETVKLTKQDMSKFHGSPTAWQEFTDCITTAINNSKSLTNVEKINYLRSFLSDDTQHTISG